MYLCIFNGYDLERCIPLYSKILFGIHLQAHISNFTFVASPLKKAQRRLKVSHTVRYAKYGLK